MSKFKSFAEQALTYFLREHDCALETALKTPAAWTGADMRSRQEEWIRILTEQEIVELEGAAQTLIDRGVALEDVTRNAFPLPGIGPSLRAAAQEVANGRGFCVLRGLPVARWGEELASYVYWGIGHHLGLPGAQNADNELLGHVIDYAENVEGPSIRSYRTSRDIAFHCDAADAVALLCLNKALEGGQSRIASSVSIFNKIVDSRPDLASRLFENFYLDRRGEEGPGEPGYFPIPAACFADQRLRIFWHSDYFRSAARHGSEASLDPPGLEVLELFDSLASDPAIHLDMWLEPGDLQLISNHTVVHARTEYTDHEDPAAKRHLLRLWLTFDAR